MQRSLQMSVRVRVAIVSGAVSVRVHVSDFNHIRGRMHTLLLAGRHSLVIVNRLCYSMFVRVIRPGLKCCTKAGAVLQGTPSEMFR
jgi:hypothetical protein